GRSARRSWGGMVAAPPPPEYKFHQRSPWAGRTRGRPQSNRDVPPGDLPLVSERRLALVARRGRIMHALFLALIALLAPAAAMPPRQAGSADERYSYAAGLFEKGLHEMAAKENAAFLKEFPSYPKANMARYRLALSLFELKKFAEAAPELAKLSQ